jgi:hypothetical protein
VLFSFRKTKSNPKFDTKIYVKHEKSICKVYGFNGFVKRRLFPSPGILSLSQNLHLHQPILLLLFLYNNTICVYKQTFKGIVTQIKRSIPDLRSIKHQPLENCSGKSHDLQIIHIFKADVVDFSFDVYLYTM